jgi:3'(2'),5'-bisphosphate nucleotidase
MQAQDLAALLPKVSRLAEAAGQAILPIYRQEQLQVRAKADASPLTEADLASHHLILQGLRELTPGIPLLSEESSDIPYAQRQVWRHFWLVDPLDGTREFIGRNGQFTVNIALIEEGIPILGVVHAPALGLTYKAAQKLGAYKGDERIWARPPAQAPWQVVASRSHRDRETEQFLERLRQSPRLPGGAAGGQRPQALPRGRRVRPSLPSLRPHPGVGYCRCPVHCGAGGGKGYRSGRGSLALQQARPAQPALCSGCRRHGPTVAEPDPLSEAPATCPSLWG